MRGYRILILIFLVIPAAFQIFSCAGFQTVTEVTLNDIPYYHPSRFDLDIAGGKAGHFPIMLDTRIEDSDTRQLWQPLLDDINAFFNDQNWTVRLEPLSMPMRDYPYLFIGNPDMIGSPVHIQPDEDGDTPRTVLYALHPTKAFKEQFTPNMDKEGCQYALFITIGFSEYFVRQRDWLGKKELYLGTGHRIPLKWLTSLDDPVEVLHFTGVLLNREGKVICSGAEGILAAKTASFFQSIINLQNTIDNETVRQLTTEIKREDLQGQPLTYQVALQNLVANLLKRPDRRIEAQP